MFIDAFLIPPAPVRARTQCGKSFFHLGDGDAAEIDLGSCRPVDAGMEKQRLSVEVRPVAVLAQQGAAARGCVRQCHPGVAGLHPLPGMAQRNDDDKNDA